METTLNLRFFASEDIGNLIRRLSSVRLFGSHYSSFVVGEMGVAAVATPITPNTLFSVTNSDTQ